MTNILIVGASGFIGKNLMLNLNRAYTPFIACSRHPPPKSTLGMASWEYLDLLSRQSLYNFDFSRFNTVIGLAGNLSNFAVMKKNPVGPLRDNVCLNLNFFEVLAQYKVENLIWVSSTTGYPESEHSLREEEFFHGTVPKIYEPVGWTYRSLENFLRIYQERTGYPKRIIIFRPSTLFGYFDSFEEGVCHALPDLIRKIHVTKGPKVPIFGSGREPRSYIFASDFAELLKLSISKISELNEGVTEIFNASYDKHITLLELGDMLKHQMGVPNLMISPQILESGPVFKRSFDLKRIFSFFPDFQATKLEDALKATVEYYIKEG